MLSFGPLKPRTLALIPGYSRRTRRPLSRVTHRIWGVSLEKRLAPPSFVALRDVQPLSGLRKIPLPEPKLRLAGYFTTGGAHFLSGLKARSLRARNLMSLGFGGLSINKTSLPCPDSSFFLRTKTTHWRIFLCILSFYSEWFSLFWLLDFR